MAKRGRKPKPPELKILDGQRADRINHLAPRKLDGLPVPPEHLSPEALEEWGRILPVLDEMGVVGSGDGFALALYCEAFAEWLFAKGQLHTKGRTVESRDGAVKASPFVAIMRDQAAQCHRLLASFGLTPSDRNRVISTKVGGKADPLDAFLALG